MAVTVTHPAPPIVKMTHVTSKMERALLVNLDGLIHTVILVSANSKLILMIDILVLKGLFILK